MEANYDQKKQPPQEMYPFLPPQGNFDAAQQNYHHAPPPGGYPVLPTQGSFPPVINQPTGNSGHPPPPQHIPNCPPGLEYLAQIDQILIKQKVELLEAFTKFETKNKYSIRNVLGQDIYFAAESSGCCTRMCCGSLRPLDMHIVDNLGNEVISLNRPLACQSCCFPCCLQSMEVSSPPGTKIGTVQQEWTLFCPKFSIRNANGDPVLYIEGPLCTFSCCGDVEFTVLSSNGTEVGKISKQWSGLAKEAFTDADNFGIKFPMDLDVKMKAVMIGACFLIDMMYFERSE